MKVLALNSSPRGGGQSKTELMLNHLVQGMQEAGAEVEVISLRKKKINYCAGCLTCWTKTPGQCIHKDDMTLELFPKWLASDMVIYAFPLYHFAVNAAMKAFIERTVPVALPFFELRNDRMTHPLRQSTPKAVVLSVAGFPEMSVFDQLSVWVQFIFRELGPLVAEIYRPTAESLHRFGKSQTIYEATRQAGREIVVDSKVSPETMAQLTQPIGRDNKALAAMANVFWKTCIAEKVTPKEFAEKGLTPRPDSVETFMMILSLGFKSEAAQGLSTVIQFRFSGEVAGSCYFKIENNHLIPVLGEAEKPDLTIETPFELWMEIMTGKADGQKMFIKQKYKVTGDLGLLLRFGQLFGK
jgi:multimeric flavodoxin WrbA/putative sterol carrier protein